MQRDGQKERGAGERAAGTRRALPRAAPAHHLSSASVLARNSASRKGPVGPSQKLVVSSLVFLHTHTHNFEVAGQGSVVIPG